jgi:hypothetical protein
MRTNLKTRSLNNQTGFLVQTEDPEDVNFSEPQDRSVFDIVKNETLVVPGCWYEAEMQIINNADVAFGYWFEIVFDDTVDLTLAEQLKITVTTVDGETSGMLNKSAGQIGKEDEPVGVLAKTGSQLFTIKLEFCDLDHSVNNNAKGASFDFDVIVHAVQITTAP